MLPGFERFTGCAIEKRDAELVAEADAVIVAGERTDLETYKLVQWVRSKGGRVLVVSEERPKGASGVPVEIIRRGLPD